MGEYTLYIVKGRGESIMLVITLVCMYTVGATEPLEELRVSTLFSYYHNNTSILLHFLLPFFISSSQPFFSLIVILKYYSGIRAIDHGTISSQSTRIDRGKCLGTATFHIDPQIIP